MLSGAFRVLNATGAVSRYQHDRHGRMLARVDALGDTTRIVRDDNGDVVRVERPDGAAPTFCDGESELTNSGNRFSIALTRWRNASYSASVTLGASSW